MNVSNCRLPPDTAADNTFGMAGGSALSQNVWYVAMMFATVRSTEIESGSSVCAITHSAVSPAASLNGPKPM